MDVGVLDSRYDGRNDVAHLLVTLGTAQQKGIFEVVYGISANFAFRAVTLNHLEHGLIRVYAEIVQFFMTLGTKIKHDTMAVARPRVFFALSLFAVLTLHFGYPLISGLFQLWFLRLIKS